jgi:hypothetical protein
MGFHQDLRSSGVRDPGRLPIVRARRLSRWTAQLASSRSRRFFRWRARTGRASRRRHQLEHGRVVAAAQLSARARRRRRARAALSAAPRRRGRPCRRLQRRGLAVLEQTSPFREHRVHGRRSNDRLVWERKPLRVQDERARLRPPEAAVERDQFLERAPLVPLGVIEAPTMTSGAWLNPSVRRRCWAAVGVKGASGSSPSIRPLARCLTPP